MQGPFALAHPLPIFTSDSRALHRLANNGLDAEAGKAIASALNVNAVLKKIDMRANFGLGEDAKQLLRDAVAGRDGFELLV